MSEDRRRVVGPTGEPIEIKHSRLGRLKLLSHLRRSNLPTHLRRFKGTIAAVIALVTVMGTLAANFNHIRKFLAYPESTSSRSSVDTGKAEEESAKARPSLNGVEPLPSPAQERSPSQRPGKQSQPVIAILDGSDPEIVYDKLHVGQTNSSVIMRAIRPLGCTFVTPEAEPGWKTINIEEATRLRTSLYIAHASAFHDSENDKDSVDCDSVEDCLLKPKHKIFIEFLDFASARDREVRFLIYSRSFLRNNDVGSRFREGYIRSVPALSGRLIVFELEPASAPDAEVYWTPSDLRNLRECVRSILEGGSAEHCNKKEMTKSNRETQAVPKGNISDDR